VILDPGPRARPAHAEDAGTPLPGPPPRGTPSAGSAPRGSANKSAALQLRERMLAGAPRAMALTGCSLQPQAASLALHVGGWRVQGAFHHPAAQAGPGSS